VAAASSDGGPSGGRGPPTVLFYFKSEGRGPDLKKVTGPRMVALRLCTLFLCQIISFKKYFYVSLGSNFYCFLRRPIVVKAPGQLLSLPPPVNPALIQTISRTLLPFLRCSHLRPKDKHTDRQTDRQTNRQTDRQTRRQTDRQSDTQTHRQTDRQTNRQTDRQTPTLTHTQANHSIRV